MRVSPTQITTGRACIRRYAFVYAHDFREPSSPSKDRGTKVHAVIERYLRDEEPIDGTTEEGAIALAGLRHFPAPRSGFVEQEFEIPVNDRFGFYGKIDYLSSDFLDLRDWKTTSDFRYAKTLEEARVDPQTILYGRFGFSKQEEDELRVQYLYLLAKKGRHGVRPLDLRVSRDHVSCEFAKIVDEAEKLVQIRTTKPDPLTLPPNPDHCSAYGGCPHKGRCTDIHAVDTLRSLMTISKESLLDKLKKTATEPTKKEEPKPEPSKPTVFIETDLSDLDAALAALDTPKADPILTEMKNTPPPPEALGYVTREGTAEGPEHPANALAAAALEAEGVTVKRPGRSKGTKNRETKVSDEVIEKCVEDHKELLIELAKTDGPLPIGTLYIQCMPVGDGDVVSADTIFATVRKIVADACQVPHYRMIDYGKGPGIFAKALEEHLVKMAETFEDPFDVVLSLGSNEASDTLPIFSAAAARVVRGF